MTWGRADRRAGSGRVNSCWRARRRGDAAFGFLGGGVGEAEGEQAAGVVLGLQQAGDAVRVEAADEFGGFFQADRDAEPGWQHVAVGVPPARLAGLAGQGEEVGDFLLVC